MRMMARACLSPSVEQVNSGSISTAISSVASAPARGDLGAVLAAVVVETYRRAFEHHAEVVRGQRSEHRPT